MSQRILLPQVSQAFDANGNSVSGALLYAYLSGTSTPTTLYADSALSVPVSTPAVADSAGIFPDMFANAVLKIDVRDPDTGASLPSYPKDPVRTTPATAASAEDVTFDPTTDIPSSDVQAAVEKVQVDAKSASAANTANITTNTANITAHGSALTAIADGSALSALTALTSADKSADLLQIFDNSAGALKKITPWNLTVEDADFGASGYIRFTGGFQIVWGRLSAGTNYINVTFPEAFQHSVLFAIAVDVTNTDGGTDCSWDTDLLSATQTRFRFDNTPGGFAYIAIGY